MSRDKDLLLNAVMFYTRIRVPKTTPYSPELLNGSRKYFTFVGVIVGTLSCLAFLLAQTVLPTAVAVLISMIASVLITGAFHEDGFADTCDGLGGGWQAEQVLNIMKDSRIGTYGTVGLIFMLGLKFMVLLSLAKLGSLVFCLCVLAAHATSRQHSSRVIKRFNYVQDLDQSKVKPIASAPLEANAERFSWAITIFACVPLAFYSLSAVLFGLLFGFVASEKFMQYCNKRIGGYTGDVLGAIQQITEVLFITACLAILWS